MVFDLAKRQFSKWKQKSLDALRLYDGATLSDRVRWKATNSSANAETLLSLEILRSRSRDLVRNDGYAEAAINAIASNTIGAGILHQYEGFDPKIFNDWAESTDCDADGVLTYYGIQNLVMREVAEAGECLIQRVTGNFTSNKIPFKLRVLGSEYLDMTKNGFFNGENYVGQGIEISPSGERVAYWLFPSHPENDLGWRHMSVRVPAEDIIHVFKCNRAKQARGVPWLAPVLMKFKSLDNYESAELKRREVSSCFAGFVVDNDQDSDSLSKQDEYENERIMPGMIKHLPAGKDIRFSNPNGDATYDPYVNAILRRMARGSGLSYEVLSGDLSRVNFSSGRMGFIEFHRNIDQWRWLMFIPQFCRKIDKWFLEYAQILGHDIENVTISHTPPLREMIDPAKEYAAMSSAIRSGLKSWGEALRELGMNPEQVLEEIKKYKDEFEKLDLVFDSDANQTTQQGILQMKQGQNAKQNQSKEKNQSKGQQKNTEKDQDNSKGKGNESRTQNSRTEQNCDQSRNKVRGSGVVNRSTRSEKKLGSKTRR